MPDKSDKAQPPKFNNPRRNQDRSHYGATHRKLRLERLLLFPFCEICKKEFATIAHHIIYPATSVEHYQALCEKCHKQIHNE